MLVRALKHHTLQFTLIGVSLLSLLAGCSHTVKSPPPASTPVVAQPFSGHITIYEVDPAGTSPQADANGLVPASVTVDAHSKDPAREAIDALISSPNSPLPHGTKLLGITIDQNSGLATVNFSSEFKDNFPGGDTREAQVLTSVEKTLGQFSSIQNIQFLVEGVKVSSLGGTQDLTDPLPAIKVTNEAALAT